MIRVSIVVICTLLISSCLVLSTANANENADEIDQFQNKLEQQQSPDDGDDGGDLPEVQQYDDDNDDDAAQMFQDDEPVGLQEYDNNDYDNELSLMQQDDGADDNADGSEPLTGRASWFRRRRTSRRRRVFVRRRRPSYGSRPYGSQGGSTGGSKLKQMIRYVGQVCPSIRSNTIYKLAMKYYVNRVTAAASIEQYDDDSDATVMQDEEEGPLSDEAVAMSLYEADDKFFSEIQEALAATGKDDEANMQIFGWIRKKWNSFKKSTLLTKVKGYINRYCPNIKNTPFYRKYGSYLG